MKVRQVEVDDINKLLTSTRELQSAFFEKVNLKKFLENNEIISDIFQNKTWLESRAYKYHFEPALIDYMGVFEIAYKMIKKHELSWSNFKMSYLYRIESLLKNPIVNKELFGNDEAYWKCFFSLVKKLK